MAQSRGFNVAHQKVSVDVDLASHRLKGWVELMIVPVLADLRHIVLDARQMTITKVQVNETDSTFQHRDFARHLPETPAGWGVQQAGFLKEKMKNLFSETAPGDLTIDVPDSVQIATQDSSATFLVSHSEQEKSYQHLTVRVYFESEGVSAGLNFVGGLGTDLPPSQWHAYTTHVPLGQATSSWVPCVDGQIGLCTWELEFSVPKTLGSLQNLIAAGSTTTTNGVKTNGVKEDTEEQGFETGGKHAEDSGNDEDDKDNDEGNEDDDDEELKREFVVVCNNNSPNQVAHPTDPNKKLVSFEMFTPIFAQHVGFALGAFQQTLISSSSEEGDEVSGASSIPFCVFSLPEKAPLVQNTCGIFTQAMEYFTREFASFPFAAYSLCFVSDYSFDAADAAGLTICTDRLLFPPESIDPVFANTEPLIRCLAAQWCGVNIVAHSLNDLWITEGISRYMTHLFVRRLMGNNEYRFRMKSYSNEIVRQDVNRAPLADPQFQFPLYPDDLEFIRLKAPMVLYILDRRMTKTDRSLGLSRVIPKLFLQSMSGDLNSQVNTVHFMKLCERVAHHRLDTFFEEWVYGSGYPIFRVTQRFNKKRMFIEMGIGQVQSREFSPEDVRDDRFLERAVEDLLRQRKHQEVEVAPIFTGPMTIRIHEADGTPYEHVVFLKDSFTKLDIQYNTKYKRLRRNQKFRSGGAETEDGDSAGLIHCMGDVLMRDREIDGWRLSDWGQDDEEYMFNEAFEWIRVDSDFEWIGKIFLGQPDYMYASQLQQDRDVVAQYEAVTFFSTQPPNTIYSSILTRTLMDRRYYYQVRVHAALGLVASAVEQINYLGKFHLIKVFQEMFCFPDTLIPRPNNFSDSALYFIQKAIITALSYVRDTAGQAPDDIKSMLLNLMRYNENSGNPFSDSEYILTLMTATVTTLRPLGEEAAPVDQGDPEVQQYLSEVVAEIDKCLRLDQWLPSHNYIVSVGAIYQEELLIRAGYGRPRLEKLLQMTRPDVPSNVRLAAIQSVLDLGGYRNEAVLQYVVGVALQDPSRYVRFGVLRCLRRFVGMVALHGEYFAAGDAARGNESMMMARQRAIARRAVRTGVPLLRETLGARVPLQRALWTMLTSRAVSVLDRRVLLDLADVLYESEQSLVVRLATPKLYKLTARRRGGEGYMMVIRYRNVLKKRKAPAPAPPKIKIKLESPAVGGAGGAPNGTALVPKREPVDELAAEPKPEPLAEPPAKPLKLKLGFKIKA